MILMSLQINYADMLNRIEPLRNELKGLEDQANENTMKHEEIQNVIKELENSIAKYKEEYALLISQAQAIKADLAAVEAKVSIKGLFWKQLILKVCSGNNTQG